MDYLGDEISNYARQTYMKNQSVLVESHKGEFLYYSTRVQGFLISKGIITFTAGNKKKAVRQFTPTEHIFPTV